jgi:hypothetical protein
MKYLCQVEQAFQSATPAFFSALAATNGNVVP